MGMKKTVRNPARHLILAFSASARAMATALVRTHATTAKSSVNP